MTDHKHYGDLHLKTAKSCCAQCGRPFETADRHGVVQISSGVFVVGGITTIKLTLAEQDIFEVLLNAFGKFVHRDALFARVWGQSGTNIKVLDVYICKLRKKLAGTGLEIRNSWGVGYGLFARDVESCEQSRSTQSSQEKSAHAYQA